MGASPQTGRENRNILSIKELSLSFKTPHGLLKALREVSLDIPQKRIVGLVGESGCGKSTLINAILNLLAENARIQSGAVEFKGRNMLDMTRDELRRIRGDRISVVFQDPMTSLNPVLSIGRQMTDIQYRDNLSKSEKTARAARMLSRVGIPDAEKRLKDYPHRFSGGMRQRIAIAMALMAQPDLLIADEPTTALDATLEIQIIERLRKLHGDIGCSILFVSHHLGLVAEFCDEVVVMYAGETVESGNVRDIFHRPAHPYTRALLECDPARIRQKTRILPTIPGEIPDLVFLNDQCIFTARCPIKQHGCPLTVPPKEEISPGHFVRCHLSCREIVS
jgi:oligopeptide/dipeptide ABC transporter ATP-binding protein